MSRQPLTLYLCPWCWYYHIEYSIERPRDSVYYAEKCQCLKPECDHGQELMPYKLEILA